MNLYVINHGFHYELENVARLFFLMKNNGCA